ncbi:MAG: hypothetical protein QXL94_06390 [Candidatus Parvarchaeum sp.]
MGLISDVVNYTIPPNSYPAATYNYIQGKVYNGYIHNSGTTSISITITIGNNLLFDPISLAPATSLMFEDLLLYSITITAGTYDSNILGISQYQNQVLNPKLNLYFSITNTTINPNYTTRTPHTLKLTLSTAPETIQLSTSSLPFRTAMIVNTGAASFNIGDSVNQVLTLTPRSTLVLNAEGSADQLDLSQFYVYSDNTSNSLAVLYW